MLANHQVNKLKTFHNVIYAATQQGIYSNNNGNWKLRGLKNGEVKAFTIVSDQKFLASVNFEDWDSLTIARTSDGGQRWQPFRNGYSNGENRRIPTAMAHSQNNKIFAGGPGSGDIAKSVSGGESWSLVYGSWENLGFLRFLKIDANNLNNLWSGGTNALFQPILLKSKNNGKSWKRLLVSKAKDEIEDIILDQHNPNYVLAGLNGGTIIKSTEGGKHFITVFNTSAIYTLAHSADETDVVYASGQNSQKTIFFAISHNFGETWETVEMKNSPADIYVNDLMSVLQDNREVLYLGTNKGIYKYTFAP